MLLIVFPVNAANILFDQAHGQAFLIKEEGELDLSLLGNILDNNHNIVIAEQKITAAMLVNTDVLISSGAFKSYDAKEVTAIKQFLNSGGTLCVMLHVALIHGKFLSEINVSVSNAVMYDSQNAIGDSGLPRLY